MKIITKKPLDIYLFSNKSFWVPRIRSSTAKCQEGSSLIRLLISPRGKRRLRSMIDLREDLKGMLDLGRVDRPKYVDERVNTILSVDIF